MGYTVSVMNRPNGDLSIAATDLPYKVARRQAIRLLKEFSPNEIMVLMPNGVMKSGDWATCVAPSDDFDDYIKHH